MTADIRKIDRTVPFVPFAIHLAVPTVDPIAVPLAGGRILVFGDNERYDVLSALLISRITVVCESTTWRQK